ncbi:hypothetical protein prwr041_16490 [Prevotella herbatica]|uniref:Uncharacterized protein n=1 Tax=Prevotella herbatica TaxID=2801997 RepID=A0ABM7NZ65_9BACT|nr:hypothetical protein prwr041_16490 [Prevotella herbatica]
MNLPMYEATYTINSIHPFYYCSKLFSINTYNMLLSGTTRFYQIDNKFYISEDLVYLHDLDSTTIRTFFLYINHLRLFYISN